jgi:hypothetical protein
MTVWSCCATERWFWREAAPVNHFLRHDLHRGIVAGRSLRRADYTAAKLLIRDKARRIAVNVAKLPGLLRKPAR